MKPEQITAWALDEASADERLQLEAELRDNPTAQKGADETKAFCAFLLAELRDESLALTDEQRARLQAAPVPAARAVMPIPGDGKDKAQKRQPRWRMLPLVRVALAACLALGSFWMWQEHGRRSQQRGEQGAEAAEMRYQVHPPSKGTGAAAYAGIVVVPEKVLKATPAGGGLPGLPALPEQQLLEPQMKPEKDMKAPASVLTDGDVASLKMLQDQTYGLNYGNASSTPSLGDTSSLVSKNPGDIVVSPAAVAKPLPGGAMPPTVGVLMTASGRFDSAASRPVELTASNDHIGKNTINSMNLATHSVLAASSAASKNISSSGRDTAARVASGNDLGLSVSAGYDTNDAWRALNNGQNTASPGLLTLAGAASAPASPPGLAQQGAGLMQPNGGSAFEGEVTVTANPVPLVADPMPDAQYFGRTNADQARRMHLEERGREPRSQGISSESYQRIVENELKDVVREPLSTFSIDVDTAAYANVRRFLNQNMIPPADAVRIEELVNYFPAAEEGPPPGAKEPFAVRVELAPCPWQPAHRLARVAIKGRELGDERKASNLVFLVDVSGSMDEPSKLPLVQQALRMLTEQLREEDRVTMVAYAGSSGLVLPPTSGDKKTEILAAIDRLKAGGSTHGSAGIQLAYEQAVANFIKGGVNRVILCTDGDFNVGVSSPEELEKLITKKAKSGVFLSVLGFGTGNLKDHTMETLADKGNGNYAYIDSLGEARKVLVEQMSGTLVTIAQDVKIQVEFNPAAVRSYRLVGYENRLLKKEDFNDDTKDAGEIGAGHCVVALYEVVPADLPPGAEPRPAVDTLRYQQVPAAPAPAHLAEAAKSGEVMTVKLRYKEPDSSLSKLIEVPAKDEGKTLTASTEEFKFSAAVAGFGLLLRDSAYKGTLGWETVRKLALDGKGADKMGYRGEFLQLIDKARGLKEMRP